MKNARIHIVLLFVLVIDSGISRAQSLCNDREVRVGLKGGTCTLFPGKTWDDGSIPYYYLPNTIRLASSDGKNGFMYTDYSQADGPEGSIMHIMLGWDLTSQDKKVIGNYLKEKIGEKAFLAGVVNLETDQQTDFQIVSESSLGEIFIQSVKSSGNAPTTSGGKMALSFHFKGDDSRKVTEALNQKKELKDIEFRMTYAYRTRDCSASISESIIHDLILKESLFNILKEINN